MGTIKIYYKYDCISGKDLVGVCFPKQKDMQKVFIFTFVLGQFFEANNNLTDDSIVIQWNPIFRGHLIKEYSLENPILKAKYAYRAIMKAIKESKNKGAK